MCEDGEFFVEPRRISPSPVGCSVRCTDGGRLHKRVDQTVRFTIMPLISAMALDGFRPLGHVFAQFMMVWQR